MRSVLIFHTITVVGKLDNILSGFHAVKWQNEWR